MELADLIDGLPPGLVSVRWRESGGVAGGAAGKAEITTLTEDSRAVRSGAMFVARRGLKADGGAFIDSAVAAGARCVLTERDRGELSLPPDVIELRSDDVPRATALLVERLCGSPASKLHLFAATGTNGKTTVTFLIHQLLSALGTKCGLLGTVLIDDGAGCVPSSLTTPPAIEISAAMARMVRAGCGAAALEASSHALQQGRLAAMPVRTAIFTNLTHDHLDYHGTMERYAEAKRILFTSLPSASDGGTVIINADDPWHEVMLQGCAARRVWCTMRQGAQRLGTTYLATVLQHALGSTRIAIEVCRTTSECGATTERYEVELPLIGDHNVMNAMQAAAAVAEGFDGRYSSAQVLVALSQVKAPPGRLEPVTAPGAHAAVYVDYAHTDDALGRMLMFLRQTVVDAASVSGGKLVCVFGCGGERDASKRPKMGRVAATLADLAIATSDNPRSEDPEAILDQVCAGVPPERMAMLLRIADRQAAIERAVAATGPGDILLIAGKGHEDYQIVRGAAIGTTVRVPFDDRRVAAAACIAHNLPVWAEFSSGAAGGTGARASSAKVVQRA